MKSKHHNIGDCIVVTEKDVDTNVLGEQEVILEVKAMEKFNLFLDENYEPPEPDYYYEPDYDDWK